MDKECTGVNIAAGQGIKDPNGGYHLARAFLFSNAKYKHCVFISYVCQNTVPNWCFWKTLPSSQHYSITQDRKKIKNINMWQPVLLTKYKPVYDLSILSVLSL